MKMDFRGQMMDILTEFVTITIEWLQDKSNFATVSPGRICLSYHALCWPAPGNTPWFALFTPQTSAGFRKLLTTTGSAPMVPGKII
jgi:hypothetical protein